MFAVIQSGHHSQSQVPMGSYHYASTSQIIFAAVDSNPKPAYKPKATEQIPIMSPPEEGAREEGPPPDAAAVSRLPRASGPAARHGRARGQRRGDVVGAAASAAGDRGRCPQRRARAGPVLGGASCCCASMPCRGTTLLEVLDVVVAAAKSQTCGVSVCFWSL